jgi:hypothetical protein
VGLEPMRRVDVAVKSEGLALCMLVNRMRGEGGKGVTNLN